MNAQTQKPIFLSGKKVILRPLAKADAPTLTRWINDPEIRRFISNTSPTTEYGEEKWLEKLENDPRNIILGIETKDGIFIGTMGLHNIKWIDRVATTGALIGEKEYWGKGYGTDAKMILLDYAFNTLNLRKICSDVVAYNARSLQYSLHCGYKEEGRLIKQFFKNGEYWDGIVLGLFKEDWLPIWEHYQKTGSIR